MEGQRHETKRQGEADGERSAEKAVVEGSDGRTKEGRGGRAARSDFLHTIRRPSHAPRPQLQDTCGGLVPSWDVHTFGMVHTMCHLRSASMSFVR